MIEFVIIVLGLSSVALATIAIQEINYRPRMRRRK
jgi:hypothetical protein